MTDKSPLMIAVAPNGARKTHADHAALPISPTEIAAEAARCRDAGAAMLHLHVRDENGAHSLDGEAYRRAIAAVQDAVGDDLIIQITTEAVGRYSPDEQIALVKALKPEAASVALKELCADGDDKGCAFYAWAADEGIALQHILYTPEEVKRFADLVRANKISADGLNVLYVLGRYGDGQSQPGDLLPFLAQARDSDLHPTTWSVCAFGSGEGAVAHTALCLGGHVRVGFENNMYLNDGTLAPDNAALVKQVADGAQLIARPLCRAAQARRLMGPDGHGETLGREDGEHASPEPRHADLAPVRDHSKELHSL